jgi:hypothetical protein
LYCRIFTEGLFGIRPTGLQQFQLRPRLPASWPVMSLKRLHLFDHDIDVAVSRTEKKLRITITDSGKIILDKLVQDGEAVDVNLQ